MDPKDSGLSNPYRVLLHRLTGTSIARPRMRSSTNTWRRTQAPVIEEEVRRQVLKRGVPRSGVAKLRESVAREMFFALEVEERDEWANQVQADHDAAIEVWKTETQADPSEDPADRQRCIEGLVGFAQPFLDLICQATGWKVTLIAGGPEPAHEGRLNVISLHSGTTTGKVKMNFGRAERIRYKTVILPVYGSFLRKCYAPEECRARAMLAEGGVEGVASMDIESDGANFDSLGFPGSISTRSSTVTAGLHPVQQPSMEGIDPPAGGLSRLANRESTVSAPSAPPSRAPSQAPSPPVSRASSPGLTRSSTSPPPPAVVSPPHSPVASPPPSPAASPPPSPAASPPASPVAAKPVPSISAPLTAKGKKRSREGELESTKSKRPCTKQVPPAGPPSVAGAVSRRASGPKKATPRSSGLPAAVLAAEEPPMAPKWFCSAVVFGSPVWSGLWV
ncbi:hypothetical protein GALMADRAFT_143468 [Galerina marginata CBS 339.88]|uniref:Uncharacterized protein n=1 Tax=Galerina marginata (strain CBS 339.88) TaxID=685588 RepID=A0A067SZF4_GALM3|nr:hypothetical protein GALMADRAFT_143468 [Galerina marginata CBS 339.88]